MEFNDFLNLIKVRKQTIFSAVLVCLLLVLIFTFAQPLKYRASTKLLIVRSDNYSLDAYSASRSNQFLANTLSEVIYSDSFLGYVLESGFNINKDIFSNNPNKKKKQWGKMNIARPSSDTGIIVIHSYYQDKYQVSQINRAIAYVLKTKHGLYHGLGDKVVVKVIDRTTTSNWPVKPNIILNSIFGILIGLVLGLYFVYLYPDRALRLWRKKSSLRSGEEVDHDNAVRQTEDSWGSIEDLIIKKGKELNFSEESPSDNSLSTAGENGFPERQPHDKDLLGSQARTVSANEEDDLEKKDIYREDNNRFKGNINNVL